MTAIIRLPIAATREDLLTAVCSRLPASLAELLRRGAGPTFAQVRAQARALGIEVLPS